MIDSRVFQCEHSSIRVQTSCIRDKFASIPVGTVSIRNELARTRDRFAIIPVQTSRIRDKRMSISRRICRIRSSELASIQLQTPSI